MLLYPYIIYSLTSFPLQPLLCPHHVWYYTCKYARINLLLTCAHTPPTQLQIAVDSDDVDFLITPLVQSNGDYTLSVNNASLESNGKRFSSDVVIFSSATR